MNSNPSWPTLLLVGWFFSSVLALCVWSAGFYSWMRWKGIEFPTWWSKAPGQRERVCRAWSLRNGKEGRWPLRTTRVLAANLAAAVLASVLYLALTAP